MNGSPFFVTALIVGIPPAQAAQTAIRAVDRGGTFRVHRPTFPGELIRQRRNAKSSVPERIGFRAPLLGCSVPQGPACDPDADDAKTVARATAYVADHLGRDGLVQTLVDLLTRFDLPWCNGRGQANEPLLWCVGLPVDLLSFFHPPPEAERNSIDLVEALSDFLAGAPSARDVAEYVRSIRFHYRPSVEGFRVMPENGCVEIERLRMQLPVPDVLLGASDGSAADMFRQCARLLPELSLLATVHAGDIDLLRSAVSRWNLPNPGRISIVADPLRVTQWAQDNSKTGWTGASAADRRVFTLVPRYASQGEWKSVFVPSESYLFDSLAASGLRVVSSPLLFQGGNLLPVEDPQSGERILFLGEAELLRNRGLGLREEQVRQALKLEFGVDRCVILPAVSFHIDLELSVRTCHGELTAFVNDSEAAAKHVVRLAIETLADHDILRRPDASKMRRLLDQRDYRRLAPALWAALAAIRLKSGELPERVALHFTRSTVECASDNLKRFLLALDLLTALGLTDDDLAANLLPEDRHDYYVLLRRRESDRRRLHRKLEAMGLRVVKVPSLSDEEVSINYINGVHSKRWFLMPTLGGFFEPLDEAARRVFARHFNSDVTILPIASGLSQRKYGGVHCSVCAYPLADASHARR